MIKKVPFKRYDDNQVKVRATPPLVIKLNDEDLELIELGKYMFNMDSKSGVMKELARVGLKVLLTNFGMDRMHYITNGERCRLIREKPNLKYFLQKGK